MTSSETARPPCEGLRCSDEGTSCITRSQTPVGTRPTILFNAALDTATGTGCGTQQVAPSFTGRSPLLDQSATPTARPELYWAELVRTISKVRIWTYTAVGNIMGWNPANRDLANLTGMIPEGVRDPYVYNYYLGVQH